jgi:selenophosphate synthetase-related protein
VGPERTARQQLDEVAAAVAGNSAIAAKREIGLVSEALGSSGFVEGPGDDGAAIAIGRTLGIVCGEAMWPPFVAADPRGAGIAAILANVNDVAAMGGLPLAIVDTIVADEDTAREILSGLAYASSLYRVPIVGGHLTLTDGPPSLSAFALGHTENLLSTTNVMEGQDLVVAACIEGSMHPEFPFFASFTERGDSLGDDVRLLAQIAKDGHAVAAKDISMAGLIGSLAMLLEWGSFGADLNLDALPRPEGVSLADWCTCFPCFGFILCCEPSRTDECLEVFTRTGLAAAKVGSINGSGSIEILAGGERREVLNLLEETVTGLVRSPSNSSAAPVKNT